jgi:hypothetical protein
LKDSEVKAKGIGWKGLQNRVLEHKKENDEEKLIFQRLKNEIHNLNRLNKADTMKKGTKSHLE